MSNPISNRQPEAPPPQNNNRNNPPQRTSFFSRISSCLFRFPKPLSTLRNRFIQPLRSTQTGRSFLMSLDQWASEGPADERNGRLLAKNSIKDFLKNPNQQDINLSCYRLSSLPDIWEHPAFSERLTALNLSRNRLQSLPNSIRNLTALTSLHLEDNQLQTVPDSLEHLTALQRLNLEQNQIESIPDFIGNLVALTVLCFNNNRLNTIPDSLGNLTNLTTLSFNSNQFETISNSIRNLRALTTLEFKDNQLTTIPDFVENYTALRMLDLSDNEINTIPDLMKNLRNLRVLHLSNNRLQTIPDFIGNFTQLTDLYLNGNRLQNDNLPNSMKNLISLTCLDLHNNRLQTIPPFIEHLITLKHLDLSSNRITLIPNFLEKLTALTKLSLSYNKIEIIPDFIGNVRSLTMLAVSDNKIRTLPISLKELRSLTSLGLSNNTSLSSLPPEILELPSSCVIRLYNSGLSLSVLHRLQEHCNRSEYRGPRILYSMENTRTQPIDTRTVNELLDLLYKIAGKTRVSFSAEFTTSPELKDWLSRLSYMADFNANRGEKRVAVAQAVLNLLELAANPKYREFHDVFFGVVVNARRSCGDSMSLSLLHLGIARKLTLLDPKDLQGLATLLLKGSWALSQLEELARNKVKSLPMVDEIEVYLGYPILLKKRLEIPIDVDEMLYVHCSGLKEEDLEMAENLIHANLQDKTKVCRFLASNDIWVKALEKSGLLTEILAEKEKQSASSTSNEEDTAIEIVYKKKLEKITNDQLLSLGFTFT